MTEVMGAFAALLYVGGIAFAMWCGWSLAHYMRRRPMARYRKPKHYLPEPAREALRRWQLAEK